MKCLICKQNEGRENWYLWPNDLEAIKLKLTETFRVANCFCFECYDSNSVSLRNGYLAEYYLSQPTPVKSHYYKWHPKAECVEISQEFCSNLGQAMQYLWRSETLNPNAVTKGQTIEDIIKDLEKAQNFIGYEIARLKGKIQNE